MTLPDVHQIRRERDERIVALLEAGHTQAEVAQMCGLTQQAVSLIARRTAVAA